MTDQPCAECHGEGTTLSPTCPACQPPEPRADCPHVPCVVCKTLTATCEVYGEDADCDKVEHSRGCEMSDGSWVCSSACWDIDAARADQPQAEDVGPIIRGPGPIKCSPELDARAEAWGLREAKTWDVHPMAVGIGASFLKRGYIRGSLDTRRACAAEVRALGCPGSPMCSPQGHSHQCPGVIATVLKKGPTP